MEESLKKEKQAMSKKTHRIIKLLLGVIAILVCIGFAVGIVVVIVQYYTASSSPTDQTPADESTTNGNVIVHTTSAGIMPSEQDVLEFVSDANGDGLNINFFHAVNDAVVLELAVQDKETDVIEGDVNLRFYGSPSQKEEAVMNNPPEQIADVVLDDWLDKVIDADKAIKLDIRVNEAVPLALQSLRDRSSRIHQPVWINAEVVRGPNIATDTELINPTTFLELLNTMYPHVTVSLGWTSSVRLAADQNEKYSWQSMDEMQQIAQNVSQRVTLLARAALLRDSWGKFLWLLEQSDSYLLTVYNQKFDVVSPEDMIFFRDNLKLSHLFYDTTNETTLSFEEALESRTLPKIFYTGGNVLEYFRIPGREAINITWVHRVVGKEQLISSLSNDSIHMLEADVRLDGEGTLHVNDSLPVMAHDLPVRDYELTLHQWLNEVIASNSTKGIKLDFKSIGAAKASMTILKELKSSLFMPVWVNADIKPGPNSITRPIDATNFIQLFQDNFPDVTLSLGWTTMYRHKRENEKYTLEMMQEMYNITSHLRQAITFPARASLTRPSISQFQWLLAKSNRYSITVWHSTSETVSTDDLLEIYNSFPSSKVFFDLPEEMMTRLQNAVNAQ